MNYSEIPEELRQLNQWVCYWIVPDEKTGRLTKEPIIAGTSFNASSTNPKSWRSFDTAVKACESPTGVADGIGFVFTDNDYYVGIDFDHCIKDGEILPEVVDWVDRFDSYTELSPSGTGLHIICRGKLPGKGINTDPVEIYDRGRYFTMTGNAFGNPRPIREAQDVLLDLCEKVRPAKAEKLPAPVENAGIDLSLEDGNILKIARNAKNGHVFNALFAGQWEGKYKSQSEADLALLNMLAFYSKDAGQLDRLFRQSGLYREKWDRPTSGSTYGALQIEKAIRECPGSYNPGYNLPTPEQDFKSTTQGDGPAEWEKPIPFDEYEISPFPEDWGPAPLRDYAAASATATQTPLSMNIAAVLAASAIPVQGKFKVQIYEGYSEPLNIYTAVVARPGERKSAVIRNVTHFISEYESYRNKLLAPDIMQSRAELNVLVQRQDRAQKEAAKSGGDMSELTEIIQEIANFKEKKPERFVCDDTTPEALTSLMYDNGGRMGLVSAEGGVFANMSRYRTDGTSDIDVYLKGHAGDTIRIDRKSRPAEYIENPCLTVLLMVQPVVIEGLLDNTEYKGRGLPARFLYVMVDDSTSKIGRRTPQAPSIHCSIEIAYHEALKKWIDYRPEKEQVITLSSEAGKVWDEMFNEIEPRLIDDLYCCSDWASKLMGAVGRIAGILHCYTVDDPAEIPISGDTMRKAASLGFCFLQHAQKSYGIMGSDQRVADAKYILRKLEGMEQITKRDLYRACRGRFKASEEMDPVLKLLDEHGYLKIIKQNREGTGQKPSPIVQVNPLYPPVDRMD